MACMLGEIEGKYLQNHSGQAGVWLFWICINLDISWKMNMGHTLTELEVQKGESKIRQILLKTREMRHFKIDYM